MYLQLDQNAAEEGSGASFHFRFFSQPKLTTSRKVCFSICAHVS